MSDLSFERWHRPLTRLRGALEPFRPFGARTLFGVRLATSVCLALYITYFLELQNSFWAATTAAIVCQPNLGASLQKGRYRVIGTIIGALVMVALLGLFAQDRNALVLSLALWCGLCGFAVVMLRNFASYAAGLAGITSAIIFADTIGDPTSAFFLAIARVSEIGIGIGAAALVILVTDFGAAGRHLAGMLEDTAGQLAAGFHATLHAQDETPELRTARRNVTRALGPLNIAIDNAIGESSYLQSRSGNLRATAAALLTALLGWRNVTYRHDLAGAGAVSLKRQLGSQLGRLDPAQIVRDPARFRDICRQVLADIRAIPSTDLASGMVVDAARDVVISLEMMADSVMLLRGQGGERRSWPTPPMVLADPLPALLGGVRVFAAVLATATFSIVTAWPSGPFAVVFAAVATLVFGSFGDQARALAKDYTMGAALMAVVGGVLYFGVLPSLSSFPALVAALALVLVPIGIMQAGTWHPIVFLAMSIASLPLLGVGNPIAYSASGYFNLALALVSGSAIGTLFFVVMPVIEPEVRARRLLALSLRDFRSLARGERPAAPARWTELLARRIEALPPQATSEQAGGLMALLALGRAVLSLLRALPGEAERGVLSQALGALAAGQLASARVAFGALSRMPAQMHVRTQVTVILDAMESHSGLLTSPADTGGLFGFHLDERG